MTKATNKAKSTAAAKQTATVSTPTKPVANKRKEILVILILLVVGGLLIIATAARNLITASSTAQTAYSLLPSLQSYSVSYATIFDAIVAVGIIGVLSGALIILSGVMISKSATQEKIRNWSIVALVFSVISFFGGGGPVFIGLILGIIGSILGLRYKS